MSKVPEVISDLYKQFEGAEDMGSISYDTDTPCAAIDFIDDEVGYFIDFKICDYEFWKEEAMKALDGDEEMLPDDSDKNDYVWADNELLKNSDHWKKPIKFLAQRGWKILRVLVTSIEGMGPDYSTMYVEIIKDEKLQKQYRGSISARDLGLL